MIIQRLLLKPRVKFCRFSEAGLLRTQTHAQKYFLGAGLQGQMILQFLENKQTNAWIRL